MDLMGLVPEFSSNEKKKEPVIKHECKVEPEEDVVRVFIKGDGSSAEFRRWLTRKLILSPSHYYAQTCLKSTTAIRYEMHRHLQDFPRMIHPFCPFRNFWDFLMTIFTLVALLMAPILNTFFFDEPFKSLPYILLIDVVLVVDIIFHFFTGYFDQRTKTVILDPKVVFSKYMKGRFFFDLMSAFPVEIIDYYAHGEKRHIDWYCSTFNYIKIFRMRNLFHYIHQFHKSYHWSFHTVKILELILIIVISMHWSACLVYYVPLLVKLFDDIDDAQSLAPH